MDHVDFIYFLSRPLGLHAIRLAKRHLMTSVKKPGDIKARSGMLLASTIAGSAFAKTGTAAAHDIGHAPATVVGIPHGRAVTIDGICLRFAFWCLEFL